MLIEKKHKTTSRDNTNIFTIKDYFKAETDTILSKQREGVVLPLLNVLIIGLEYGWYLICLKEL